MSWKTDFSVLESPAWIRTLLNVRFQRTRIHLHQGRVGGQLIEVGRGRKNVENASETDVLSSEFLHAFVSGRAAIVKVERFLLGIVVGLQNVPAVWIGRVQAYGVDGIGARADDDGSLA